MCIQVPHLNICYCTSSHSTDHTFELRDANLRKPEVADTARGIRRSRTKLTIVLCTGDVFNYLLCTRYCIAMVTVVVNFDQKKIFISGEKIFIVRECGDKTMCKNNIQKIIVNMEQYKFIKCER